MAIYAGTTYTGAMGRTWDPGADAPLVGVVEGSVDADRIVAAIEAAAEERGATPRTVVGPADRAVDRSPAFVVAAGEPALLAAAKADLDGPVLPVAADPGIRSVAPDEVEAAIGSALDGDGGIVDRTVLGVRLNGDRCARAVRELSLITAEPARISEFGVTGADPVLGPDVERTVASVRADGIVVATPAGSHGYAATADGPLLDPGTGLAIVPIAPFVTDHEDWVVEATALDLSVRRDEVPVRLRVDGGPIATVEHADDVTVIPDGTLRTLVVPESEPPF